MTVATKGFAAQLQAGPPVLHARISGVGGYRPRRIVPNTEIVDRINSSDEWIRERSGIIERRWAGEGESVVDMSEFAAAPALEMAGIEGSDVDVDRLADRVARAADLIGHCRQRIDQARLRIDEVIADLDASDADDAPPADTP